ncbi:MAG: metallophosphoesterase family protein [Candidatus Odinarchaeia archaeon]
MNALKNISSVLIISDPHGERIKVTKNIDLVILLGDYGDARLLRDFLIHNKGTEEESLIKLKDTSINFIKDLRGQTDSPIIALLGNADLNIRDELLKIFKENGILYADNSLIRINDSNVLFLDFFMEEWWCRENKPKRLRKARVMEDKVRSIVQKINKIDFMFSHSPPYGFLDFGVNNKHYGCKIISELINKFKPRICFSGHNHKQAVTIINKTALISVYKSIILKL